jgi:2-succinyl-6-hydroxy-2,4-cyclohexadiene-1-carboxylate synthase
MARSCNALAELMDRIRAETVCWLGYSLGGRLALGAAIALRDRCPALILESASPGLPSLQERTDRTRSDSELAAWIETVGIEPFVDHWEALDLWASQLKLPDQGRGVLRAQRLENRGSGLANSLRGIGTGSQPSFHHDLPGLRTPVCLIAGEEDDRYSRLSGEMHAALPASQLRIVPAAGHAVHFERPPIFNEIVLSFLQSLT